MPTDQERNRSGADRHDQPEAPPARPTAAERAAADRVLARFPAFTRDQLLPVLHEVHAAIGWFSEELTRYLSERLRVPFADLYGVVTFYALFKTERGGAIVLRVCKGIPCYLRGAPALGERLQHLLGVGPEEATADGRLSWEWFACLGQCDRAPAMLVGEEAIGDVEPALLERIVDTAGEYGAEPRTAWERAHLARPVAGETPALPEDGASAQPIRRRYQLPGGPAMVPAGPDRLLARCGAIDPSSIAAYEQAGGFRALRHAIERGPAWVIDQLTRSGLVGRGGAAFPTGRKWEAVRRAPGAPKYVVLNADESEPGTFSNRKLLEEDPFASVEAMIIAGLTVGSAQGYAYVRGEYALAAHRLAAAIATARDRGYLGDDAAGSGRPFAIEVRRGGGAYICGEETALFNSLEGRRGEPRAKPPFPVQTGLFRKPTLINNVETLVNVPPILTIGGDAFAAIGVPGLTGTRLFCLSGHIAVPGVYEVPGGATLRALIALGGGVPGGRALRAVLLGGAAGAFVPLEHLDTPLVPGALAPLGLSIGSGAVILFDETVDMWEVVRLTAEFFAEESCGQCVPCRIGTRRQVEILHRLSVGRGRPGDEALLRELGAAMTDASICGLGQTAAQAVLSALAMFPLPGEGRA